MNSSKSVLFLDIDGVLNSKKTLGVYGEHLSSPMVRSCNKIVKLTACDVVISSSWRVLYDIPTLQAMLFNQGFTWAHKIVGRTDDLPQKRGYEIQKYLDEHDYSCYCILDDETDMLDHQKPFFIRTNWDIGLTDEDAENAIKLLGQVNSKCQKCNGYGFVEDTLCTCRRDGIKNEL